ncbi:MAG: glycosyltransferase [Cyanobacteria bacterium J06597_1]
MGLYVLSKRNAIAATHYAHIYALENVIQTTCNAQIVAPVATRWARSLHQSSLPKLLQEKITNRVLTANQLTYRTIDRVDGLSSDEPNVLIVIGMHGADLELLNCLKDWRSQFDLVIAFVYDAWIFDAFPNCIKQVDCLFVAIKDLIEPLHAQFKIPVSYWPYSANVLDRGSYGNCRSIDVTSYGRIPSEYHNRLFDLSDRPPASPDCLNPDSFPNSRHLFYYRQVPEATQLYPDQPFTPKRFDYQHSVLIGNVLAKSKLALAFDFTYTVQRAVELPQGQLHPSYEYRKPVLGLRWYEGIAAGTALVGKRPPCSEANEQLDWEDATIELPDEPDAGVEIILELLQDIDRLQAIHHRNYWNALYRHDHRRRLAAVFAELDLPMPTGLQEQLDRMDALCARSGMLALA